MSYDPRRLAISAWLIGSILACQSNQQGLDPLLSTPKDSLITVAIPDFAAIVTASRTPRGKLDRIITTYGQSNPVSSTINLLYDAQQRVIGLTALSAPSKGVNNAVIYEYQHERPYRTFSKATQPGTSPKEFYFMQQMVYDATGRQSAQLLYRVELDGQARLLERQALIYDSANRLIEIKDPSGVAVGQLFEYAGNNMKLLRHKDAKGVLSSSQTEYYYDSKPNILKGIYWTLNLDYIHHNLSDNNFVRQTVKSTSTNPDGIPIPTDYLTEYDAQQRLIHRSISSSPGLVREFYIFND
ncbi:hypothetical protein [Spirosoma fluviale]|uniref:YD repeat-containing protein n=1 Tax=Spirosoma fluviale TaxID=1597977 RepID=A0A286GQF3_9BACT|nr:hypothetical protein [Spirosoma fluviale]SOD97753.1 hypothetical protein SAMN06269250_5908 [Spirosoma fluviale]